MADDLDAELAKLRRLKELEASLAQPQPGIVEKAASAGKDLLGFAKEAGNSLARGYTTSAANLLEKGMPYNPFTLILQAANRGKPPSQVAQEAFPKREGMTPREKLFDRAMEGAGGAAVLPAGGFLRAGAAGAMGGVSGELAGRAAAPAGMWAEIGADMLGSALGGGLTGFALGPRQSVAQADIRRALEGTTPGEFRLADKTLQDFNSVGATTATAAEAFPGNSAILAMAQNARGGPANNALRLQTQNRPEDLQKLGETFIDRIGPRAEPNTVANKAEGAANAFLATEKSARGEAVRNALTGETIKPLDAFKLFREIISLAKAEKDPGQREAYVTVAKQLLGTDKKPFTDVQQLSLQIKALKDSAKNPLAQISGTQQIDPIKQGIAISYAEDRLKELSPKFKMAMDDFEAYSRKMGETRSGPIGRMAAKNPLIDAQAPMTRVTSLLEGNSPQTIQGVARQLENPILTQGTGRVPGEQVSPLEMASAIAQSRLKSGSTDPGKTVRGLEGSDKEKALAALLEVGGKNPDEVLKPLAVADKLQSMAGPAGVFTQPRMAGIQALIRPFRTIDMALTGRRETGVQEEIAQILAANDPGAVRRLQEIAMFDPNIRRALSLAGMWGPQLSQPQQ